MAEVINGTAKDDRLTAVSDALIKAGAGDDTINVDGAQNVTIETGSGKDEIIFPFEGYYNPKVIFTDFDPQNDVLNFPEWAFFHKNYYFRAAVQDGNLVLKDGLEWYTLTFQGVTSTDEIKDTFVKRWEGYNGNLGGILYNTVSGSSTDDDGGNNAPADNDIITELAEFKKNLSELSDKQNESFRDSAEKLKSELEKIKNDPPEGLSETNIDKILQSIDVILNTLEDPAFRSSLDNVKNAGDVLGYIKDIYEDTDDILLNLKKIESVLDEDAYRTALSNFETEVINRLNADPFLRENTLWRNFEEYNYRRERTPQASTYTHNLTGLERIKKIRTSGLGFGSKIVAANKILNADTSGATGTLRNFLGKINLDKIGFGFSILDFGLNVYDSRNEISEALSEADKANILDKWHVYNETFKNKDSEKYDKFNLSFIDVAGAAIGVATGSLIGIPALAIGGLIWGGTAAVKTIYLESQHKDADFWKTFVKNLNPLDPFIGKDKDSDYVTKTVDTYNNFQLKSSRLSTFALTSSAAEVESATSEVIYADNNEPLLNDNHNSVMIYGDTAANVIVNQNSESVTISGNDGNDSIVNFNGSNAVVYGNNGDDSISNLANTVEIFGGKGNNTIRNFDSKEILMTAEDGNDYIDNAGNLNTIDAGDGNNIIDNIGASVSIVSGEGVDTIDTFGVQVHINSGAGNDVVRTEGDNTKVYTGAGNDSVENFDSSNVLIEMDFGEDYLETFGNSNTIRAGNDDDIVNNVGDENLIDLNDGDDYAESFGDSNTINGGNGSNCILNVGNGNFIFGGTNDDIIELFGEYNTVNAGTGNDFIYNEGNNILFNYVSSDGNDLIEGFNETSTLDLGDARFSSLISDDDIILTVNTDKITLIGAANLSTVNIVSTYDTTPADTTPADTTPADTTPADTTPADTTPADTTPADTTPADTTPADTTPADTTPADTTPADTTPADTTPAYSAPEGATVIDGTAVTLSSDDKEIFIGKRGASLKGYTLDKAFVINAANAQELIDSGDFTLDKNIFYAKGQSPIVLEDYDTSRGTFVNIKTADGRKTIFGWSPQSGGVVDGNDIDKSQVIFGDAPNGNSTIRGGNKNDSIYAGAKDVVSLSGGHDELHINDETSQGVTVDMGDGSANARTRVVDDFDVTRDLLKIDSPENINARILDGSLQFIKGDSRVTFDELATFDDANGLQVQIDGKTYKLRNDYDSGLKGVDYFWTDTDGNYYITDSTFRIHDDGSAREYFIAEGSGRLTIDGFNFGRDKDKLNLTTIDGLTAYGDNLYIESGDSDVVEVTGGAGKTIDVKLDGTTYTAQLGKHLTYDLDAEYYGDLHGGTGCAISVAASFAQEAVAIYLNEEEEADGKIRYYGGVTKIDASAFTGRASLVGSEFNDKIIAAQGATSLWGGESGDDELFGTGSGNSFFYCMGNGDDKIYNAANGDAVNLVDIRLEDITNSIISDGAVTLELSDGGRLTVMNSADVTFNLGDGTSWKADRQAKEWQQQA